MPFSLRRFITFITLLFVLGQGVAFAFHSHTTDHAHDPAQACPVCQVAQSHAAILTSPAVSSAPIFSFSQKLVIPFTSETIALISNLPPARAPPLV